MAISTIGTDALAASAVTTTKLASGVPSTSQLPAGTVLQTKTATDSTERSTSSTGWVTASNTLSVTITPTSASSKMYVVLNTVGYKNNDNNSYYTIYRDSTNLGTTNGGICAISPLAYVPLTMTILDSPATTSAITYQLYFRFGGGSGACYINAGPSSNYPTCSITVMEIAA